MKEVESPNQEDMWNSILEDTCNNNNNGEVYFNNSLFQDDQFMDMDLYKNPSQPWPSNIPEIEIDKEFLEGNVFENLELDNSFGDDTLSFDNLPELVTSDGNFGNVFQDFYVSSLPPSTPNMEFQGESEDVGCSENVSNTSMSMQLSKQRPNLNENAVSNDVQINTNRRRRQQLCPIDRNTTEITFSELTKYFHMPITQAARELKVGLTVLKKRCREFGIPRWPHRKMKSLESLIHNIQELGKGNGGLSQARLANAVEILEEQKRLMEAMPGVELAERTKRLRQACFKANYKKRRQLASCSIKDQGTSNCGSFVSPNSLSSSSINS